MDLLKMALFRKLECRLLVLNGKRTSIALEPAFWAVADNLSAASGITWRQWAAIKLADSRNGRASVLRVAILTEAISIA
jgi:predicted DNA-binding ribbon-helix-helix protein